MREKDCYMDNSMTRQTQIQIACILSDIFLESALHYKDNDTIDESLTKAYYARIASEVLQIYPHFSKKDLDSIFPTIAYYCMHTISRWIFYDDWSSFDKEVMKRDLESQWRLNYIFGLLYKHKVKYKYRMLCNAFSFSKDETIWSKDSPIPTMLHIPLLLVVIGVVGVSLFIDLRFGLIVLLCVVVAFVLTCIF